MAYKISENFTLEEMYSSASAKKYGIDNTPSANIQKNLVKLVANVLQPIRDAWGKPIVVSSGYRCEKLNSRVGGAKNSQHCYGTAADIHTKSDTLEDNMKLFKFILQMVKDKKITCRQIIFEYGKKDVGPDWVHVSIQDDKHTKQTNNILYLGCK